MFLEYSFKDLERSINYWLSQRSDLIVKDIKYCQSEGRYTAMIIYIT